MTETNNQEQLTIRQQDILGILVREYVHTAQPVGSLVITQKYGLSYSSATVRNELAYLEEAGYLSQPHTSAGRVPTEKGYRYFVARLMDEAELPLSERTMIRHQFHQLRMDLDQWMRLAAAVLAHALAVSGPGDFTLYTPGASQTRQVGLSERSDVSAGAGALWRHCASGHGHA